MIEKGTAVRSLAGKDKGGLLAVAQADARAVFVCDGGKRPVERPKKKNVRHVESVGAKLTSRELATNGALRKALGRLASEINGEA